MPRTMMSDFSGMVCEIPPKCQFGCLEKNGPLDGERSHLRHRSSPMDDDETLKYLTHEEKDVLLFFEETIDALEDDLEEQALHDSGIHCHSPRSMEENTSSHSEPEDIIDLVESTPENSDQECVPSRDTKPALEETWKQEHVKPECSESPDEDIHTDSDAPPTVIPSAPPLPVYEAFCPPPPVQHPKLLRSIPTPLIIAQKISEKQTEGSPFSPASPKFGERKRGPTSSPIHSGDRFTAFKQSVPPPTAPKPQKFPSNISITNVAQREFSKTIAKAAVNIQERKAQVLANVNGSAFLVSELEERLRKHELLGRNRSSSLRDLTSERARNETLNKLGLAQENLGQAELDHSVEAGASKNERAEQALTMSNGYRNIHEILKREPSPFPSMSKTVTFKPDTNIVDGKTARQNTTKSFYDFRQPDFSLEIRRRSGSLPRPSGLRPQGITVQFSGRGSTEEARREALRKLGLLKE
ncbi:proline and serine-rich protein 2 [Tiliqua scincoides]|uniref:proline and serine-rich protein 2 n=1 Tax=Tiliqua scincoides TaxID=71010 RepID=UPI0034633346